MRSGEPTWPRWMLLGSALLVPALLAGCTTTVTGTASPAGSATAAAATGSSAQQSQPATPQSAQLTAAALQLGDLPVGWAASDAGAPDAEVLRSVSRCLGAPIAWVDVAQLGYPSTFVDDAGEEVGSFADSYHSQQDVDGDAALLRDSRAPGCLGRAIDESSSQTSAPGGPTVGAATFTVVAGNGGGPANVAGTGLGTVPVTTTAGQRTTVYIQFVLITGRLTEAQLFFLSRGAPLPADLRAAAIAAVAQRVAAL